MKKIISTELAPEPIGPYNQAVAFGELLFVSGQIAIDNITGELKIESLEEETHLVVNKIYGSYFSSDFPARECVAVKTLPKSVNVEISAIAHR